MRCSNPTIFLGEQRSIMGPLSSGIPARPSVVASATILFTAGGASGGERCWGSRCQKHPLLRGFAGQPSVYRRHPRVPETFQPIFPPEKAACASALPHGDVVLNPRPHRQAATNYGPPPPADVASKSTMVGLPGALCVMIRLADPPGPLK